MAWTQEEHNRIVSALVITTELVGVTYSKETARFFLHELEPFPADVVLRALERGAKELSRLDFCLSAVLERAKAERRAPPPRLSLTDSAPPSPEEKQRALAIVSELVRRFSGEWSQPSEGERTPQGNGVRNPPPFNETEKERE